MKKLIINMLLLFGISVAATAQAYDPVPMAHTPSTQPENNAYFNNVSQNGYYNEMYRTYWVWDLRSMSWVKRVEWIGPSLPTVNTDPRYKVTTPQGNTVNSSAAPVITGKKPGG